jgi:hypothetical protein
MKEKNEYPTISRKDHNKQSDSPKGCKSHPKGGKFWAQLVGVLSNPVVQTGMKVADSANKEGQAAEKSLEEKSKSRMRSGMKNMFDK